MRLGARVDGEDYRGTSASLEADYIPAAAGFQGDTTLTARSGLVCDAKKAYQSGSPFWNFGRRLRRQLYPINQAIIRTMMIASVICIQNEPPMPLRATSTRSPHG
jgi:hypothetical protein